MARVNVVSFIGEDPLVEGVKKSILDCLGERPVKFREEFYTDKQRVCLGGRNPTVIIAPFFPVTRRNSEEKKPKKPSKKNDFQKWLQSLIGWDNTMVLWKVDVGEENEKFRLCILLDRGYNENPFLTQTGRDFIRMIKYHA